MQHTDAKPPASATRGEGDSSPAPRHERELVESEGSSPISSGTAQRADPTDPTDGLSFEEPALLDNAPSGAFDAAALDRAGDETLYLVGVGASAGGLDALEQFFGAMSEDSGMAFVVIQHLSPDFKSVMDELLARRTKIPIVLVEDGMQVQANHIYLIPPKKEMIVSGGKLLLSDKGASQELMLPIDIFFRSLAEDMGERAIGIVLSGAGSDGARGIRDIHEAGGLVLCQDESSAYFDGMPRSARETGVVDFILPPAQMPSALLDHVRDPDEHRRVQTLELSPARPYGVSAALRFLQNAYGIDFTHYKPSTVVRRIERRLQLTQSDSLEDYVERLAQDTRELDDLFHDLLIGVTRFFRDEGAFECLESRIIPELVERMRPSDELRVWVAGCATGEEAYSIAILMQEELRKRRERSRLKILATDVHRGSLDFASRGLYTEDRVNRVRPDLLERYFDKRGPNYQVSPELRSCVVFAPHNVIKDAPFTRIDLVTCRNLLIYLQPLAQKKVLGLLHFALKRNGVLMLGPSEHVGPLVDDFESVDVHWRVYRKHRDLRHNSEISRLAPPPRQLAASAGEPRSGGFGGYSLSQTVGVYDALLEEYMPPSLLVNERRELVHAFSGASRYLKVKEGRPSSDLLDMVGPDLKMAVTGAMQRALKERTAVTYNGLMLTVDGKPKPHRLLVKPVVVASAQAQHVLITIDPLEGDERPPPSESELDLSAVSRDQLGSLENELRRTKESLQATIEELETSNEELQATNEELLASNEELQSTNEELQSVNEELYTVNAEYQKKIGELTELTNDMDNLLASIQVGTIFLDRKLCIRKFTPLIAEVFNLLPQDVGRPIAGFASSLKSPSLTADLAEVLSTERAIEREVCDRDDNWFFQRILPYRMRGTVHGVVLTLIDINPLKAAENAVFRERYLLDSLMDSVPDAIYFKDTAGRFVRVNQAMAKRLALSEPAAAAGHSAKDFLNESRAKAIDAMDEPVLSGQAQPYREEVIEDGGGRPAWMMSTRQPLRDGDGQIVGMLSVSRDISAQKRIEDEIRLAVRRRDEFLAMLSHELRNPLAAIVNAGVLLHSDTANPSTRRKGLQVIERQSRQMTRLLDDLLEVSRITQGKIELRKQTIDARQVVKEAMVALRERFQSRGISLSADLGQQPVLVEADPARLQQIVVNLLDNAAKYTAAKYVPSADGAHDSAPTLPSIGAASEGDGALVPSGGRTILELRAEGQEAVLEISDNGVGIEASVLDNVFEPFVQGATTIHRTEGGMGVGLSVVRSLVQMHDGSIVAHSEGRGLGSRFIVRIPLSPASSAVPGTRRNTPWSGGKRVVVIEDNPDGAEMLSLLLEHAGYEVFTAEDGKAGVELIERVSPDVALVDIGLPVMDGFEVARWVRASERHHGLYMLALTGYGQAGDRAAALQAGFDEHLVKPVDAETLRQVLQGRVSHDGAGAAPLGAMATSAPRVDSGPRQ
ncbi:MAG TPA: chemotaxis protein CheB [Polyangiaceae bacterium]|nr:chemotaxis protein CheB [Polyangiaceae bacterium]